MSCKVHQECGTTCIGVEDYEKTILKLKKRVAELEHRKCSHGDYRMYGTDDCKNWPECESGGRISLYTIGPGLCVSCENSTRQDP